VRQQVTAPVADPATYYALLVSEFEAFPDDLDQMYREGLAYFTFSAETKEIPSTATLDELIASGSLTLNPITYEDFLPISAAGIFQSNLDERETQHFSRSPNQQAFERDLGCPVIDEFKLYADIQRSSLVAALQTLQLDQTRCKDLLAQLDER
jgi:uncharacterized glyoxalase superfamily metalloenzyme YdcJ